MPGGWTTWSGSCARFPTEGAHDDQVGALSYAAAEAQRMGGALSGAGDSEQREVSSAVAEGRAVRLGDRGVAREEDAELRRLLRENWEEFLWE